MNILTIYLAIGLIVEIIFTKALEVLRPEREQDEHPVFRMVVIILAWPICMVAFLYGMVRGMFK